MRNDNSFHMKLNMTISDEGVDFLDLKVRLRGDGMITNLHRKNTATNILLHYSNFHPNILKHVFPKDNSCGLGGIVQN